MPSKIRRDGSEPMHAGERKARSQKHADWEDRLRLVGDARFIDVEWSGRDNPSWPLPIK